MLDLENVRVITHRAIRIEGAKGTVVYFDPFGLTDADATHDAGYVLITHNHFDHLSPEDFARVANKQTVAVAPASAAADAQKLRSSSARLMSPGDMLELPGIHIEAVPAYNTDPSRLANHPQANGWLGYVVTLDGEHTRYFVSGDTDQNADNEKVSQLDGIRIIGYITKPELGLALITRDGQEFELKAQGWNPLRES